MANGGVFAAGQAVPVRTDYTASEVRRFAKRAKGIEGAWHLRPCSTGFRVKRWIATLRGWVIRFNQQGPDGRINIPSPGAPPKLDDAHKAFLRRSWRRARSLRSTASCAGGRYHGPA